MSARVSRSATTRQHPSHPPWRRDVEECRVSKRPNDRFVLRSSISVAVETGYDATLFRKCLSVEPKPGLRPLGVIRSATTFRLPQRECRVSGADGRRRVPELRDDRRGAGGRSAARDGVSLSGGAQSVTISHTRRRDRQASDRLDRSARRGSRGDIKNVSVRGEFASGCVRDVKPNEAGRASPRRVGVESGSVAGYPVFLTPTTQVAGHGSRCPATPTRRF